MAKIEAMTSDLDIYRSAQVLVREHGPDAPIHAAMRADAMLEVGDLDGYAVWKRILLAVEELQRAESGPRAPLQWPLSRDQVVGRYECWPYRMSPLTHLFQSIAE